MICRVAVRSVILAGIGITIPTYAAGQKAWSFKGACSDGDLAESDGTQTGAAIGTMSTKDYLALMKRARDSHLTLGADGFLWSRRPLNCDSVIIMQIDDYEGHTAVSFANGNPDNPILIFSGGRIGGDGPLFFSDNVYLGEGKAMRINPNGKGCHFYFADHGTFTQGWESRLTTIELRMKTESGHLISAKVRFDASQSPLIPKVFRDPATDESKKLP